ncbi:rhamnulokinase [Paeniglutamicibacter sp. ABSL32-1]|uniref:rhamnulokinase n=1 Tax=Paeniglutamicibacter quisquiliarum TaxID=2849498 RepID=UPI001C2D30BA|nr:rhamnulokinase family protein [Paeniglutamicibacter quisquiliarum]MBV1781084.1 rhamnulokinase [Paeniglutamicibacter quisquiliarum]
MSRHAPRPAGSLAPVAAIDLGATSGRVMLGELVDGKVVLTQVHRFANGAHPLSDFEEAAAPGALAWDLDGLWAEVRRGLALAFAQRPDIASIGVDSWAVDYALLRDGERLGQVRHYRDPRNERAVAQLEQSFSRAALFGRNGLQFLPFNTVYQLEAERGEGRLAAADTLLLVPDYLNWLLTGAVRAERTNASTTGLLNISTGTWDAELAGHLGVAGLLPDLVEPGDTVGMLRPELAHELGATGEVSVTAVASHDTASAVAAAPLGSPRSAYVSCGTWGLVGVELPRPALTEEARQAGFTNELGLDGTVRLLKNVTGTWLLSESIRYWNESAAAGTTGGVTLESLLPAVEALEAPAVLIDPAQERFMAPGNLPERIVAAVLEAGGDLPESREQILRIILESLAASFATEAFAAAGQGGFVPDAIHMLGGGSQSGLLCQLTADRAGVPVFAGPVECTALGNVLVQLRTRSGEPWTMGRMRALVRDSVELRRYAPSAVKSPV